MTARALRRSAALLAAAAGVVLSAGTASAAPSREPGLRTVVDAASMGVDQVQAERQSAILAEEDQRLLTLVASVRPGSGPYVQTLDGVDTLVLTAGGAPYGLADLIALGAVHPEADGAALLTEHVFVAPGAHLALVAPGTELRLASSGTGFTSIVAWKAQLDLTGSALQPLRVVGWDDRAQRPDETPVDGRAYVRDVSGDMRVSYVQANHLGFWAGRTSGVAWTGNSSTPATGAIVASRFSDNHYGAFASQGEDLSVEQSVFTGNAVDGLSLHRSTAKTTVTDSTASHNGRHGFSADQGSEVVTFDQVTSAANTGYGIFFSGAPLAVAQSAGGASLRNYGQLDVAGGTLADNGRAGLRVVDGSQVTVSGTTVRGNLDGIDLAGTTAPTRVTGTTVTGDQRFGITVTGGTATVQHNQVRGAVTGVRVRDADVNVQRNTLTATGHGISVVGRATGSSLTGNTVSGRGPSAVDTYRIADDASVVTRANNVDAWDVDRDNSTYWREFIPNHPMLLLWVVVLGAPLALTLRGRRRRVAPGTAPYRDDIKRQWAAPRRVDVGRRVATGRHMAPGGQA